MCAEALVCHDQYLVTQATFCSGACMDSDFCQNTIIWPRPHIIYSWAEMLLGTIEGTGSNSWFTICPVCICIVAAAQQTASQKCYLCDCDRWMPSPIVAELVVLFERSTLFLPIWISGPVPCPPLLHVIHCCPFLPVACCTSVRTECSGRREVGVYI